MIVQRTKTYAVCPTCQADAGEVDHLLGTKVSTRWYCDACGHNYQLAFSEDGAVAISPLPGRRITTLNVLKLPPQEKPVFFVVKGMRFEAATTDQDQDQEDSTRFFYEEHSCPTNWLKPEMVYYDGDCDPHGLIQFVTARDESTLPPDEAVSPNDHDQAIIDLIEASPQTPVLKLTAAGPWQSCPPPAEPAADNHYGEICPRDGNVCWDACGVVALAACQKAKEETDALRQAFEAGWRAANESADDCDAYALSGIIGPITTRDDAFAAFLAQKETSK